MSLDAQRWQRVSPLLDEALELPAEAREAWLQALQSREPDLVDELRSLLAGQAAADRARFLTGQAAPALAAQQAGRRVGAYTLLEPLGEGGMGAVWLAERHDGRYEGRAAVKLLHAGLLQRALAERFRREGAILAKLSHPHIARLLDAGLTDDGQPYLVLEHVAGQRIDLACDARQLGVRERIVLFAQVLEAVQHAHNRLVVHRDLKPGNVMVDAAGTVKLLDFGIAKLLDSEDSVGEATALTQEAGRVLTPQYAAPEQRAGEAVTTATDVYALGLLLYELLTGQHPRIDAQGRHEPAPGVAMPLASRVVTDAQRREAAELERHARARGTAPARLAAALAGDIDNILLKALRHDAAERYATVDAFADDLRRHLAGETVSARPDSLGYRVSRFIGRHRIGTAATAAGLMAIVAAAVLAILQAQEARHQRSLAERSRDAAVQQQRVADSVSSFMVELVGVQGSDGLPLGAAQWVDHASRLAGQIFSDEPQVLGRLLGVFVERNGDLIRYDLASADIARLEKLAEQLDDSVMRAEARCWRSVQPHEYGDQGLERLLNEIDSALASLPDEPRAALVRARCLVARANTAAKRQRVDEALENLAQSRSALVAYKGISRLAEPLATYLRGNILIHAGRFAEADREFRRELALHERYGKSESLDAMHTLSKLRTIAHWLGRPAEAYEFQVRASTLAQQLDKGRADAGHTLELSFAAWAAGFVDIALKQGRTVDATVDQEGLSPPRRTQHRALMHWLRGERELAIRTLASARPVNQAADTQFSGYSMRLLQVELMLDGDLALKALPLIEEGLAEARSDGRRAGLLAAHARALNDLSRPDDAVTALGQLAPILDRLVPADLASTRRALADIELGRALRAKGREPEAREAFERALRAGTQAAGPMHPLTQRAEALLR